MFAEDARESTDIKMQLLFIAEVVMGRLCIPHGAGAHQWNIQIKHLFKLLYVRSHSHGSSCEIFVALAHCQTVDEHRSNLVRTMGVRSKDGATTAISSHICPESYSQSIRFPRLMDHCYRVCRVLCDRHICDNLCLYTTRKDLE